VYKSTYSINKVVNAQLAGLLENVDVIERMCMPYKGADSHRG